MFFKIESWNFQVQWISWNLTGCLIELKFCEVSRNSISNWTWNFSVKQNSFVPKKKISRCQFQNKKALFTVSIFPKVLVFPSYKFPLDFSSCAQMIAKATNVYPKKSTTFSKSLFFLLVMYVVSNLSYSSKVSTTSITAMLVMFTSLCCPSER